MDRKLTDLSSEELGRLFPIIISEPDPAWSELYLSEKAALERAIGSGVIERINHYGSTAVPNLCAKPTIDILLEIREDADKEELIARLQGIGYLYSPQPRNPAPHMMFMKGYTPYGFKGQAYHVHVRYFGDWREIYFRDYLIRHPDVAQAYGRLKLELKERYQHDREAYTEGKTDFIQRVTNQALKELAGKDVTGKAGAGARGGLVDEQR